MSGALPTRVVDGANAGVYATAVLKFCTPLLIHFFATDDADSLRNLDQGRYWSWCRPTNAAPRSRRRQAARCGGGHGDAGQGDHGPAAGKGLQRISALRAADGL